MKTIKQIADELGVSKTAVRKKMTPEVRTKFTETVSGVFYISDEGETIIKTAFVATKPQTKFAVVSENQFAVVSGEVSATLVEMLRQELAAKDKQINDLNARLADVTAALVAAQQTAAAAQALHAGTIHAQIADEARSGFWTRLFRRGN